MGVLSGILKRPATVSSAIQNCGLPDYNTYTLTARELFISVVTALVKIVGAAILCYNSLLAVPVLCIYVPYHISQTRKRLLQARKWTLNLQFADAIRAISTAIEAGYSVENAISEAYRDLSMTYSEEDLIMRELAAISARVRNNRPVEEAFSMLAARSGLEDVASFADVFVTAKRTGGNIIAIIRSTSEVMRTRIELSRELKTAVAAKKYESDIMKIIPCAIIIYLRVFSPDMLAPLYGNLSGILFMTGALVGYVILSKIADRIVEVEL